eukprot:jgi/Bigna1/69808/fgenesh1_pg.10_\
MNHNKQHLESSSCIRTQPSNVEFYRKCGFTKAGNPFAKRVILPGGDDDVAVGEEESDGHHDRTKDKKKKKKKKKKNSSSSSSCASIETHCDLLKDIQKGLPLRKSNDKKISSSSKKGGIFTVWMTSEVLLDEEGVVGDKNNKIIPQELGAADSSSVEEAKLAAKRLRRKRNKQKRKKKKKQLQKQHGEEEEKEGGEEKEENTGSRKNDNSAAKDPEALRKAAANFPGIDLRSQSIDDIGESSVYGRVLRMGQLFFRLDRKKGIGLKPVRVKKGDKMLFVKTFKRSSGDTAEWPNGLHCLKCPFTTLTATENNKSGAFNVGYLALEQIVARTSQNKKQLAVRVLPVLIHPKAYEAIYQHVPGGNLLAPPTIPSVRGLKGYSETWNLHLEFREYVTEDFVENYSKRMANGRSVQTYKDKRGNVLGAVFNSEKDDNNGNKKKQDLKNE